MVKDSMAASGKTIFSTEKVDTEDLKNLATMEIISMVRKMVTGYSHLTATLMRDISRMG